MKLSVIVPCYNESAIAVSSVFAYDTALSAHMAARHFDDYELIFVNDGSKDNTEAILHSCEPQHPHLRVLGYPDNHGKGCAVRTGICASTGDFCVYSDCDIAYGTDIIAEAADTIRKNQTDFLIGSRAIHPDGYAGYTWLRKVASVCYLRFLSMLAGFPFSDSQCGFKMMRGDAGRRIFSKCRTDGFAFDFELLMRAKKAGMTFSELPVKVINHRASSIHLIKDSIHMLCDIRKIRRLLKQDK